MLNAYNQPLYGTTAPGIAGLVGGTGGLLGGVPGGLSADAMKELANLQAEEDAKQEVQNAADEAKEAAKTPRDKYNEAETAYLSGNVSPLFDQVARSNVEAVFGECKIVSSTFGYGVGGFVVQVMVPEKVTAEKFDQLVQRFVDQGYASAYGEITADAGMMMLEKDDGSTVFTFNFDAESDEQGIAIMYSVNE
ncbi:MAG: hypothetical protein V1716_02010 [Candidatus Uhrbacteria bacterium]